jgi:hypothetical protein
MSNGYAIAGVSEVLRGLLAQEIAVRVNDANVNMIAPDLILADGNGNQGPQLNLFFYRVTPNLGWQNEQLPSLDARGDRRLTNPPLALNLHYLLTAYANERLQAEILLGWGMHALHRRPVLSREMIVELLGPLENLGTSGLAEQAEYIRVTPEYFSTEELSKLWTAVQSHYRPTVAYVATVVLIQATDPTRTPLPVLTIGPRERSDPALQPDPAEPPRMRERGVVVEADVAPQSPTIERVEFPVENPADEEASVVNPAVELGGTVFIHGHHLDGTTVSVRLEHPLLDPITLTTAETSTATRVEVQIPEAPADWVAGIYQLTVLITRPDPDQPGATLERETNTVPLILAPAVEDLAAVRAGTRVTVTLTVSPHVRREQGVSVILGTAEAPAEPFPGETAEELAFVFENFTAAGQMPVRIRVNGVDSLLIDPEAKPPAFREDRLIEVPSP